MQQILRSIGILAVAACAMLGTTPATATSAKIGEGSCTGAGACTQNTGNLSNNSCNGDGACFGNEGDIGA